MSATVLLLLWSEYAKEGISDFFFFFRERWLTLDDILKLIIDLQKCSYAITILTSFESLKKAERYFQNISRLLESHFYILFSSLGNKYPVLSKIHLA